MKQGIAFYAVPASYLAFECDHIITLNNSNNNFTVAETKWSILRGQTQVESAAVGFPLLSSGCLQADISSKQVMKAGQEVGTLRERFVPPTLNVCIRTGLIALEVLLVAAPDQLQLDAFFRISLALCNFFTQSGKMPPCVLLPFANRS